VFCCSEQLEADFAKFLLSKIPVGQKFEINLLGIGGESLVAKIMHGQVQKAFKIIPLDGVDGQTKNLIIEFQQKMNLNISESQFEKSIEEARNSEILSGRAEYEFGSIKHENIIDYENVTLDLVDGHVCLIAGNFRKILHFIFLPNFYFEPKFLFRLKISISLFLTEITSIKKYLKRILKPKRVFSDHLPRYYRRTNSGSN